MERNEFDAYTHEYRAKSGPADGGIRTRINNPDGVAYCEAGGWRAYYDRDWITLLRLTIRINREQFQIPRFSSLLAAYWIVRASIAWVPKDHDADTVRGFLERYYRLAKAHSGLRFDPVQVAALEFDYWDVHRRLYWEADKAEFVRVMSDLHGAIFSLPEETVVEFAVLRVEANNVLDTITSGMSDDLERDWQLAEDNLRRCYRSINAALAAA